MKGMWIFWGCSLWVSCGLGDEEKVEHGGSTSPKEKRFEKEHYANGEHHADLDHEAILGSKKDAEAFSHLSPEESKRRLRVLAEKIDIDGNGYVSRSELTEWIHQSLKNVDLEEMEARLKEMDKNEDGTIDWTEYYQDTFGEDESELDDSDKKLIEEDKKYFAAADQNGDGKLNKEEYALFHYPESHEEMHAVVAEVALNDKDLDGDGQLTLNEFLGKDTADNPTSDYYKMEKERFETEYDADKNGLIDKIEILSWVIPKSSETAEEETAHLFKTADKDKDDQLSIDEIVDEHELFVGSEATNYGEYLAEKRDEL